MNKYRSPRRDEAVDKIRTMYWFQYLGKRIGSLHPRVVQRAISPLPTIDAYGGPIKNNKFLGYSRGDHVPNAALVRQAATHYPESARILNHVLWDVLREKRPIQEQQARLWIGQLDLDVQKAVIKQGRHIEEGSRTLDMLKRRPSLDSLVVLTILFRFNHQTECAKDDVSACSMQDIRAWNYVRAIFQVLMMMEVHFISDTLREHIFQLFVERVFSLRTSFWKMQIDLDNYDYPEAARIFREQIDSLLNDPESRNLDKQTLWRSIRKLIDIPFVPAEEEINNNE